MGIPQKVWKKDKRKKKKKGSTKPSNLLISLCQKNWCSQFTEIWAQKDELDMEGFLSHQSAVSPQEFVFTPSSLLLLLLHSFYEPHLTINKITLPLCGRDNPMGQKIITLEVQNCKEKTAIAESFLCLLLGLLLLQLQ